VVDFLLICQKTYLKHQNRCDLHITAASTLNIQIQVELEVTDFVYSMPTSPNGEAVMIMSVMINRPCIWARNGCEFSFSSILILFSLLSVRTWYGKIGVEFNTKIKTWSLPRYKRFIKSISSCYSDPEAVKKLRYVCNLFF
jgi:hypothetical protein